MSERILKALMQLFAIIAKVEDDDEGAEQSQAGDDTGGGRQIVLEFLQKQLSTEQVEEYIQVFDEFLEAHQGKKKKKDGKKKRTSVSSVKVLRICTQINEELAQKQKVIVLIRILEFINAGEVTDLELEFASTVADTFNINNDEYELIKNFVEANPGEIRDDANLLVINDVEEEEFEKKYAQSKHIYSKGVSSEIRIIRIPSVNLYFLRYFGEQDLILNGQVISNDRNYVLTHGSSLRSPKVKPIYHSDIVSRFLSDTMSEKIVFKAKDIQYRFKGGNIGLHDMDIIEQSGNLVGIMGGSGAGKSTLLNVLNGNYTPTEGSVSINGVNIHSSEGSNKLEGVIGYVSQDDLLIEELTVFQNLFYNAKLCFGDMSDEKITKLVLKLLSDLGLYETKDLKVGSPLEKTISGGQRKRVNIGLELIREPSVLFVDEPTSGLSSRDSQNIMDLLKELTLKGKLIFVVIHQPSSDIFKMFDNLIILDLGGYIVYQGNPVDGIAYFKDLANYANVSGDTSGNVNPEEIFDIIDAKVVDEYGNPTDKRKVSPEEWYTTYEEKIGEHIENLEEPSEPPQATFKIPNVFKQFRVFMTRDILSKMTNTQYMLINMIEAPALAAILAFFVKFYNTETGEGYIFRESENLPQYLFISVVVALFIGLTVSAEEIIKDQKILKREQFLNLSKVSYLNSKICIMFLISAIQMILYVVVGNLILGIHGMTLTYWMMLFSVSCFANVLGLNISASFNSAKVIYILIPILIIPQLLFSGVIVKFDKLHPAFSSDDGVPLIGNVMASRWAYEGLAVAQFKENDYESQFYVLEQKRRYYINKKDFWVGQMTGQLDNVRNKIDAEKPQEIEEVKESIEVLRNEINKEEKFLRIKKDDKNIKVVCGCADGLSYDNLRKEFATAADKYRDSKADPANEMETLVRVENYLETLKDLYRDEEKKFSSALEKKKVKMQDSEAKKEEFRELKDNYTNDALTNFVTNRNSATKVMVKDGKVIIKSDPVYMPPYGKSFFNTHFYAPHKYLFGTKIPTKWANIMVIWFMTFILIITLYFDAMKKTLDLIGKLSGKLKFKRKPKKVKQGDAEGEEAEIVA